MFKKIVSFFFVLLYSQIVWSADAIDQLRNFSKNTKTSMGDFVQQQVSQTSDGKLKVNKEFEFVQNIQS